jgi:predicted  nucleic acid-binding Zn-ribbon protein
MRTTTPMERVAVLTAELDNCGEQLESARVDASDLAGQLRDAEHRATAAEQALSAERAAHGQTRAALKSLIDSPIVSGMSAGIRDDAKHNHKADPFARAVAALSAGDAASGGTAK